MSKKSSSLSPTQAPLWQDINKTLTETVAHRSLILRALADVVAETLKTIPAHLVDESPRLRAAYAEAKRVTEEFAVSPSQATLKELLKAKIVEAKTAEARAIAEDDADGMSYHDGRASAYEGALAMLEASALSPHPPTSEVERLRSLCAELYQVAGVLNADARVLDNLSAAATGKPIPHDSLLPYGSPHPPTSEEPKP